MHTAIPFLFYEEEISNVASHCYQTASQSEARQNILVLHVIIITYVSVVERLRHWNHYILNITMTP